MLQTFSDPYAQNFLSISETIGRTTSDEDLKMIKKPMEEGEAPSGDSITTLEKPGADEWTRQACADGERGPPSARAELTQKALIKVGMSRCRVRS